MRLRSMVTTDFGYPLRTISRRKVLGLSAAVGLFAGLVYWIADSWLHATLAGVDFTFELFQAGARGLVPRALVALGTFVVTLLSLRLIYEERTLRFVKHALDYAGDSILWISRDGTILYVNESATRYLGYSYQELVGREIFDIDPIYHRERWPIHWTELRKRGTVSLETIHHTRSGQDIPVEITARLIVYRGQEINCAVARDISERRRAEERIRSSEERVRLLLESTGEGIIGVDTEGRCTFINPAALQMLGCRTDAELLGKELHPLIHHARKDGTPYPAEDCPGCRAYLRGQAVPLGSDFFWRQDGSGFDVEYRIHPLRRNGDVVGAVYAFSDISKRIEAERELRRYAEELKEANRLKDLFTDILRHDLMNPASAIKMSAEVLSRTERDPVKSKVIDAMSRSIESLIDQCDNAARYARIARKEEVSFDNENLVQLIDKAVRDLSPQIRDKSMSLEWNPSGEAIAHVSPLIVDVFSNLISNAIKYSPKGSSIKIGLRENGDVWLVFVSDKGEGIPDKDKKRIFTRFERAGKQGVKGSGLGLAIAKEIVGLHSGKLWVEDNAGGGSIFFVEIPKWR